MIDSRRFGQWVPIFKGGIQKDTRGREHNGDNVIDRIIQTFNPSHHEPPLTLGEVKDNSPAFGWVRALKDRIVGGKRMLFAKFSQLHPLVSESLKGGGSRFDVTIYKDGRLRQVALRDVTPPRIPLLKNVNHSDGGEGMTFEFSERLDAADELDRKAMEILNNQIDFNETNFTYASGKISYREAFKTAMEENPGLVKAYVEQRQL